MVVSVGFGDFEFVMGEVLCSVYGLLGGGGGSGLGRWGWVLGCPS